MVQIQPDPVTNPISTLDGSPHHAQLPFVKAELENPLEHFSRHPSLTPDRLTPESQRTQSTTQPDSAYTERLEEARARAATEAKLFEQFYAGRALLRKEEPERHGIFGKDPAYWDFQTSHWKAEYQKLVEEYDRRRQLEAEGKAMEGYAQALLLSPIQSPSSPPSDGNLRATAARVKKHKPIATRPSQQPVTKSPSQNLKKRSSIDRSSYSSVSDSEYEPITRPNSAIDGFPSSCQVQYVNEGLEKNPHPREDFYRQFSVTPERQTPEDQRTPHWPTPDPEEYREAADGAEEAANSLKRFYAGRVLLRRDPNGSMVCGHDPAHWRSKAKEWLDEVQKLEKQYERRIVQEQRGKAEKGYAQALLLSPLQLPFPQASGETLRATVPKTEGQTSAIISLPKQPIAKTRSQQRKKGPHPQQPTPDHSSDSFTEVTKNRKRSRAGFGRQEDDERNLDQARLRKRQRREMTGPTPTQKPDPVARTARASRKKNLKVSKASTKAAGKRKKLLSPMSQTPRVLPWDLRSRDVISYHESGRIESEVVSKKTQGLAEDASPSRYIDYNEIRHES